MINQAKKEIEKLKLDNDEFTELLDYFLNNDIEIIIDNELKITNEEGQNAIGKPIGDYITIDVKKINLLTDEEQEQASNTLAGIVFVPPKSVLFVVISNTNPVAPVSAAGSV